MIFFFFFQAEDGIRDLTVTGVQTCALPISQFDSVGPFAEGLARVKIGERWGYLDRDGTIVINPQFEQAFDFNRSEERRVGKSVDLGGRRIIKKKKHTRQNNETNNIAVIQLK